MMRPVLMLLGLMIAAEIASAVLGYQVAYKTGYGAFSMLAGVIAITFFWLWARRSTPLALGMAFSWIGSASVMGWWWMFSILDQPHWMVGNPVLFLFLSVYFIGAIMHLEVIGRSFGVSRAVALLPVWLTGLVACVVTFFH